ncbi:MAG: Bug family tripartite tricarboxylate transporter substrate binding protein [Candidatus Binatia bacterium]
MVRKLKLLTATVVGIGLFAGLVFTATAAEFFKGKTITFVVGFSAGGGFDTYTRLIGRHISRHIPGNPQIVVQNRTGAGSLIAANYIYNRAKRDGTVIGNWIGGLLLREVLGDKAVKFKGKKFNWLGVPTPDNGVCAFTKASGIKNIDDWFASKRPVKIGATAPGSSTDDPPKLLRVATGLPLKVIEGYKGTARIRLAAESGEVDGGCWAWQSVKVTWRKGIESGNVRPVLQMTLKSHPELKHIPLAMKYAKTADGRALLKVANDAHSAAVRPYSLPPGVPKDRVRILQKAFMDTMRDPAMLREAKKSKLEITPIDGPTTRKVLGNLYKLDPAMISRLKEILLPKRR